MENNNSSHLIKSFKTKMKGELQRFHATFFSLVLLILLFLIAWAIPYFSKYTYYGQDMENALLKPFSSAHLLGTDEYGRDFMVRMMEGLKISIIVGSCAALIQLFIGVVYGAISGYLGGFIDDVMMRFADVVYAVPYLIVVILLTLVFGNSLMVIILSLAVTDWTGMARVMRVQVFKIKEMEFVAASKVMGASPKHILCRHILPNSLSPIFISFLFSVPSAIFGEAFLSFLGLGVSIPKASLGTLAKDGYTHISSEPWLLIVPIITLCFLILLLNLVGEGLKKKAEGHPLGGDY